MHRKALQQQLWYAAWLGVGLWLARISLVPAPVRNPRLSELSGSGPFYAKLDWSYGLGARPLSIIFDLELGSATGSVTSDGEALEAEIPLASAPRGPYRLSVSATYRVLGLARTVVSQHQGSLE